jgi:hypothetical protein
MALIVSNRRPLNAVTIISRFDSAVDNEATDWESYDNDPITNASAIKIKSGCEPTKFIMNFDVTGKEAASIKDSMIKGMDQETKQPNLAYGKWSYCVVKMTLKDIQNPPNTDGVIEFKKDGTGYVMDSVLSVLERAGVLQELFNHYLVLTNNDVREQAKN